MVKKVNRQFFSTWNPDMAYVFGFWFADGWMSQPDKDLYITFTSADLEHLQIIQVLMESEHKIYSRVGKCYDLTIGSKQLWQDLYFLGGRPAKSLVAEMPLVPKEYLRHFMRGYVDGDGSVIWDISQRHRPYLSMVGGMKFLSQVAVLLDEETGVGIARVKVRTNRHKAPELIYTGIKAKTLAKWLYSHAPLALERKAKIAHEFATWEPSKFGWWSQAVMTPKMQAILSGEIL
jgi:hypothetical protein